MKPNKYVAFYRKARKNWGVRNNSSPNKKQNKLKYMFETKEEADKFIDFLLKSEIERFVKKKKPTNGKYQAEVRAEKIFVMLELCKL